MNRRSRSDWPSKSKRAKEIESQEFAVKQLGIVLITLVLSSGCVVVGGYSSERGWFIWPGTIVIFVVVAILFLLIKRRR